MTILLFVLLAAALFLWGRSVATTLGKSFRELGIYLLAILGILAIGALVFYSY